MSLDQLLAAPPTIVAAGVDVFSDALRAQGAEIHNVDWRAFGDPADLALDARRAAANRRLGPGRRQRPGPATATRSVSTRRPPGPPTGRPSRCR